MRPSSSPVHKLLYAMFYLLVILVPTLQLQLQGPEPPVGLERHHDAERLIAARIALLVSSLKL